MEEKSKQALKMSFILFMIDLVHFLTVGVSGILKFYALFGYPDYTAPGKGQLLNGRMRTGLSHALGGGTTWNSMKSFHIPGMPIMILARVAKFQ